MGWRAQRRAGLARHACGPRQRRALFTAKSDTDVSSVRVLARSLVSHLLRTNLEVPVDMLGGTVGA